jgi:hypothetical protein
MTKRCYSWPDTIDGSRWIEWVGIRGSRHYLLRLLQFLVVESTHGMESCLAYYVQCCDMFDHLSASEA